MKTLENDYDAPEQEAGELDAGSPAPQDSDDDADAYDEFVADRRMLRYEDTPANRRKLFDYLLKYRPALPETPAALYLAFDELCKDDKLELIPLAPERTDERTAGEVQAEEAEGAEPDPTQNETTKSANAMTAMFRKRPRMVRFKNGAQVS